MNFISCDLCHTQKCIATGQLRKYTSIKCVTNVDLLVYRHAEDMHNLLLKRSTTAVQCQHQMLLCLPEHVEYGIGFVQVEEDFVYLPIYFYLTANLYADSTMHASLDLE